MAMTNYVMAGDYTGLITFKSQKKGLLITENKFFAPKKWFINKETVERYEVISEDSHKSMGSGIARGLAGASIFGSVGAVAGATSGKSKEEYMVSIVFKDGTKALCGLDKSMYKWLVTILY